MLKFLKKSVPAILILSVTFVSIVNNTVDFKDIFGGEDFVPDKVLDLRNVLGGFVVSIIVCLAKLGRGVQKFVPFSVLCLFSIKLCNFSLRVSI